MNPSPRASFLEPAPKSLPVALATMLFLSLLGCSGDGAPPIDYSAPAAPSASSSADSKGGKAASEPPPVAFTEADFIESEESRDPYREYSSIFIKQVDDVSREVGRKVKASMFAIDELKLVAIITEAHSRAMLVDPKGFGWIIFTGDFLGKAELVNTGGTDSQEIPVNWKVDRIRGTDIVFVREDPSRPQIARTTRILPLYPSTSAPGGS